MVAGQWWQVHWCSAVCEWTQDCSAALRQRLVSDLSRPNGPNGHAWNQCLLLDMKLILNVNMDLLGAGSSLCIWTTAFAWPRTSAGITLWWIEHRMTGTVLLPDSLLQDAAGACCESHSCTILLAYAACCWHPVPWLIIPTLLQLLRRGLGRGTWHSCTLAYREISFVSAAAGVVAPPACT
jgi:hypothetical protein